MPRTLKQTLIFDASPAKLFAAFTRTADHKAFTRTPARVSPKAGATFTAYGGYIRGVNLDVRRDERLVQAWRGNDWPAGEFSIVRIEFKRMAKGKTRLTFIQRGIPYASYGSIKKGWETFYWTPLRKWLER